MKEGGKREGKEEEWEGEVFFFSVNVGLLLVRKLKLELTLVMTSSQ